MLREEYAGLCRVTTWPKFHSHALLSQRFFTTKTMGQKLALWTARGR
jgi:hypothetical protein